MKRITKFGLLGITLIFGASLVACNQADPIPTDTNSTTTAPAQTSEPTTIESSTSIEPSTLEPTSIDPEVSTSVSGITNPKYIPDDYQMVDMTRPTSDTRLSSIGLNLDNAKLEYNMGDTFDPTGIVVTATYITSRYDEALDDYVNIPTEVIKEAGFYYDTSLVNFDDSGIYPVTCVYRDESRIVKSTFQITVRSSKLVESKVNYNAGLEVTYENKLLTNYTVYLNSTFTMPSISCYKHVYNGKTQLEGDAGRKAVNNKAITVDTSAVDTSKEGSYMVKLTYPGKVTIEGKEVDNTTQAFFVVSVINPVVGVEWSAGDLTLEATPGKLDLSSWKISLTKTVAGTDEIVSYSDELFELTGVDQYNPGTYTATITLKANKDFQVQKEVTIVESTKYIMNRLMGFDTFIPYVPNGSRDFQENGIFYSDGVSLIDEHNPPADSFDNGYYSFHARYKLSGAGTTTTKNFSVVTTGPAYVTLYFATGSSGNERIMRMLNANGDIIEEVSTKSYRAYTYTVTEAGRYYFVSSNSGMNIYGCIVSYAKEAN